MPAFHPALWLINVRRVKYLVELHGGTVSAESAGPGKGSIFSVTLPIPGLTSRSTNGGKERSEHDLRALKDKRILIVEDEADTRDMLAYALKQRGAKPIAAESAKQAFRLLEKQGCDLVISDIGMPEADGYQLLAMIRAQAPEPPPAVAITAYATAAEKEHALRSGFQAHLSKPVELSKLVSVIAGLVRRTDY